ncbi:MAG: hypothetical protein ACLSA6_12180 [Holdemania massiliensis]
MVKAVYVHAPDKSSGHWVQDIDISYDLIRILPYSLLNSLQKGETAQHKLCHFTPIFLYCFIEPPQTAVFAFDFLWMQLTFQCEIL